MPINNPEDIHSYGKTVVQRTGNLHYFGTGIDGNVTISTDTFLTNDMYYNNLTINSTKILFTNGFKVFVKGTLTNNGVIGTPTATAATSTYGQTTTVGRHTETTGNFYGNVVAVASANDLTSAVNGILVNTSGNITAVYGGAAGNAGNATAGGAGSVGANGSHPSNSTTVGAAGGKGETGNPGNPGTGSSAGPGGGVVVISAKTITGTGTFLSEGGANVGSPGNGTAGNAGATAPTVASVHNPAGGHNHHNSPGTYYGQGYPTYGDDRYSHISHGPHVSYTSHGSSFTPAYPGGAGGAGGNAGSGNAGNSGAAGTLWITTREIDSGIKSTIIAGTNKVLDFKP